MIVEKNDVDISRLFVWSKKFDIVDKEENVQASIYLRLLGDADMNRARVYAIRRSAELRRKLRDADSDERLMYVRDEEELTKEELINYIVMFALRDITNTALKEVKVPAPKQPKSSADLEKMEKYQKEIDEYPAKVDAALKARIEKETNKVKEELEKLDEDVLYKRYLSELINELCEQEALSAFNDMELYLGCYKDEALKERAFDSFEDYDNQPMELKNQLRAAYSSIRVPMDELKKLREATP